MQKDPFEGLDLDTWFTDRAHPAKDLRRLFAAYHAQNELEPTHPRLNFAVDLTLALAKQYCTVTYYPAGVSYGFGKGVQKKDRVTLYFHKGAQYLTKLKLNHGGIWNHDVLLIMSNIVTDIREPRLSERGLPNYHHHLYRSLVGLVSQRLRTRHHPCPPRPGSRSEVRTFWYPLESRMCSRCPELLDCTLNNHPLNTSLIP